MTAQSQISAAAVVVVGSFTPVAYSPRWFVENKIIGSDPDDELAVQLISPEITSFSSQWFNFLCDQQRATIAVNLEPVVRAHDIAIGFLRTIAERTISQIGLNRDVHIKFSTQSETDAVADLLCKRDAFLELPPTTVASSKPGLRAMNLEFPRQLLDDQDPSLRSLTGSCNLRVEVSNLVGPFGVYLGWNNHFAPALGQWLSGDDAASIVDRFWQRSMRDADAIRTIIVEHVS